MLRRFGSAAVLFVAVAVASTACATLDAPRLEDALSLWSAGDGAGSLALARETYRRFREANDLGEPAVRAEADRVREALDETPQVASTDTPLAPPDPDEPGGAAFDEGTIDLALRADLLGPGAVAAARAVLVVSGLGLRAHVPSLLAIVFTHRPHEPDGALVREASPALRSVVVKRLALDALEALAPLR